MDDSEVSGALVKQGDRDLAVQGERVAPVNSDEVPTSVANALVPATASPPVPAQRSSHVNASKLASEKVVIAAPMSFAGSAARIWKLTGLRSSLSDVWR